MKSDHLVVDHIEGADVPALTEKARAFAGGLASKAAVPTPTVAAPDINGRIKFLLSTYPVILFMKGSKEEPKCGFSGRVVEQLSKLEIPFHTIDILQDQPLREGLKAFSDWPTYPQLYIAAELVGGCDIVTEMCTSGELKELVRAKFGTNFGSKANASAPVANEPAVKAEESKEELEKRIKGIINSSPVMLFMKGTPEAPRCGFSSKTYQALTSSGISFKTFDILADEAVRQGLKLISNWPTYPQLFVKGELLGGCDIVLEMRESGELKTMVDDMLKNA
jgi:Grx4 family monothiol glutaredoxin